jgi:uncharacterized UBP type Zn finger protein
MICCDVCEDWFHGKCVNITKAMGQQMEEDGIEWTCPNCIKKKQMGQKGVHSAGGSVISPAFKVIMRTLHICFVFVGVLFYF